MDMLSSARSLTFAIIVSLLFVTLLCSYYLKLPDAFAAYKISEGPKYCGTSSLGTHCCWQEIWSVDAPGQNPIRWMCEDCYPNGYCVGPYQVAHGGKTPPGNIVNPQPPTEVAPPKVCPDGSAPDANGVCPPVTQGSPPTSSPPPSTSTTPPPKGTTGQPPTNLAASPPTTICPDGSTPDANGNCPQVSQGDTGPKHHNKGSELSQQTPSSTDNGQQPVEKTSKGNKATNSILRGSGDNNRKGGRYLASP